MKQLHLLHESIRQESFVLLLLTQKVEVQNAAILLIQKLLMSTIRLPACVWVLASERRMRILDRVTILLPKQWKATAHLHKRTPVARVQSRTVEQLFSLDVVLHVALVVYPAKGKARALPLCTPPTRSAPAERYIVARTVCGATGWKFVSHRSTGVSPSGRQRSYRGSPRRCAAFAPGSRY